MVGGSRNRKGGIGRAEEIKKEIPDDPVKPEEAVLSPWTLLDERCRDKFKLKGFYRNGRIELPGLGSSGSASDRGK